MSCPSVVDALTAGVSAHTRQRFPVLSVPHHSERSLRRLRRHPRCAPPTVPFLLSSSRLCRFFFPPPDGLFGRLPGRHSRSRGGEQCLLHSRDRRFLAPNEPSEAKCVSLPLSPSPLPLPPPPEPSHCFPRGASSSRKRRATLPPTCGLGWYSPVPATRIPLPDLSPVVSPYW